MFGPAVPIRQPGEAAPQPKLHVGDMTFADDDRAP